MSTPALRKAVEAKGGTVHEGRGIISTAFPGRDEYFQDIDGSSKVEAHDIDAERAAAFARAKEYGTAVVPLRRSRGTGWFFATSHTYPGEGYVTQVDPITLEPLKCECAHGLGGGVWCHHHAAAVLFLEAHPAAPEPDYGDLLARSVEEASHAH